MTSATKYDLKTCSDNKTNYLQIQAARLAERLSWQSEISQLRFVEDPTERRLRTLADAPELEHSTKMERESNPMQAQCRSGCGFYGSPATDGLCSLCYKEALKKKQQPPNSTPSGASSVSGMVWHMYTCGAWMIIFFLFFACRKWARLLFHPHLNCPGGCPQQFHGHRRTHHSNHQPYRRQQISWRKSIYPAYETLGCF